MEWKRWHPPGAWDFRRVSRLAAIEQDLASFIAPNKVAPTLQVGHAAPSMSVQRNCLTGRDSRMEHSHLLVFQQQGMVIWRSHERVERVRPRPTFRICKSWIAAH
jgi:hypothetical protein